MGLTDAATSRELHPVLAQRPGHLVWRAHARVALALADELPAGVDLHAYAVLLALAGDVTRSQQELADSVSISRTTMARVATDLVARGMVERVRNPADRRSYALTRTASGAAAAHEWQDHADALQARLTAAFTAPERDDLLELLLRVVDADIAPDAPPVLRGSMGFLISRIHFRMHRDFLAALEPLRLEPRLYGALTALSHTGPIAQAELARLLGISAATIVQIADTLEERGFVERRRDPADRRTQLLYLQPGTPAVLERANTVERATLAERLHALSAAETERLVLLLQRFVTAP